MPPRNRCRRRPRSRPPPGSSSTSSSGQALAGQRANEAVEPASITKLMTAYAVFHALQGRQAQARHRGADQRARLAFRRFAHLPRPRHARAGRGPDPGHDRAERQRRDDRARRGRRRHRGHLRGAHEPVRRAARPGAEPLPELDGPARRQPQDVGDGHREAGARDHPRVPASTTAGTRSASSPGTTSASRTATACSRATRASTA